MQFDERDKTVLLKVAQNEDMTSDVVEAVISSQDDPKEMIQYFLDNDVVIKSVIRIICLAHDKGCKKVAKLLMKRCDLFSDLVRMIREEDETHHLITSLEILETYGSLSPYVTKMFRVAAKSVIHYGDLLDFLAKRCEENLQECATKAFSKLCKEDPDLHSDDDDEYYRTEICKKLLEFGADVRHDDDAALLFAIDSNRAKFAKVIVKNYIENKKCKTVKKVFKSVLASKESCKGQKAYNFLLEKYEEVYETSRE